MIVVTLIAIATARGSSSPLAVTMRISYSPMIGGSQPAATEHPSLGPQMPPGTDCVSTFAGRLDVDTLYGQLLHRMPAEALGAAIFAGVVPDAAVVAAERPPPAFRATLGIHLFGVAENGEMGAFHAVRGWAR
jgi:hypothetical protein